jgi:hypothetical protein
MATFTEADVLECACLHKQVVEWVGCPHAPSHIDLGDAVVRLLGSTDPITIRAVQAACAGRRLSSGAPRAYHGPHRGP